MNSESVSNSAAHAATKREGKIFVGGLTWDTSIDDVKSYFRQFGNVIDASIIKDPSTGRSRGFGFVVFDDEATVKRVFDAGTHFINGKKIDAKNAFRRNSEPICRKIFVGGVDPLLPESEIREYFSKFGQIEEIDFPWDKEKNQRRAFCFVAFVSPDIVDEILKQSKHKLGDRMVDVKKATPKQDNHLSPSNSSLAWNILSQALNINNNSALLASLLANPNSSSLVGGLGLGTGITSLLSGTGLNGSSTLSAAALQAALTAAQSPNTSSRLPSSAAALAAAAAAAALASHGGSYNGQSSFGNGDDGRIHGGGSVGSNGSHSVVDALSGLNYGPSTSGPAANVLSSHLSSLLGSQANTNSTQNPYFALAAAAAAAGLYPPSPSADLTNWYSNLAMAAAAATNQDGHTHNSSPMLHQSSHRDMAAPNYHHGGGHGSSGGSHAHMSGSIHGSGGGYGKASRSSNVLSPNPVSGGGGHRNTANFHPYSR